MINPNGGVDAVDGPQDVGVALLPGDPPAELGVVVALLAPLVAELLQGLATGAQFNRQFFCPLISPQDLVQVMFRVLRVS